MHLSVLSFRIAENKKGPLFKVLFNHFVHFFYTFLTVFNGTVFLVILKCVIGTVGNLAAPFLKLVLSRTTIRLDIFLGYRIMPVNHIIHKFSF